jgi:hypothetical protein
MYSFNELQEKGAEKFGANWLTMQREIAEVANLYGLDPKKNREVLARIAWRVLVFIDASKGNWG